jgi:hypothetical protein
MGKMIKLLCIGGPAAGQQVEIDEEQMWVNVDDPAGTAGSVYVSGSFERGASTTTTTYRPVQWGTVRQCLVPETWSEVDAFRELLEGYAGGPLSGGGLPAGWEEFSAKHYGELSRLTLYRGHFLSVASWDAVEKRAAIFYAGGLTSQDLAIVFRWIRGKEIEGV